MVNIFKLSWKILVEVLNKWMDDNAPKLAAALSFYTIFSTAPLLIISVAIAGFIYGNDAAHGGIVSQIENIVGHDAALFLQTALVNASKNSSGIIATIISIITLIISVTAIFVELKDSLNRIWQIPIPKGNIFKIILKERLVSLMMALLIGLLFLTSLISSTILAAVASYIAEFFAFPVDYLKEVNNTVNLVITFILFTLIYKILPDTPVLWRDAFRGSLVTVALFYAGRYFIGMYLAAGNISTTYGAASSLAVFLIWVYYSAMVFFLGAEFTYVFSIRLGKRNKNKQGKYHPLEGV